MRDLAERGVMQGRPGAYILSGVTSRVSTCRPRCRPRSAHASTACRTSSKTTLNAASVIGLRFDADLLTDLVDDADMGPLIAAEVVDQVAFTDPAEYAFRHPLIRAVAYESQLKSERAQSIEGLRVRSKHVVPPMKTRHSSPAHGGSGRSAYGLRLAHASRELVDIS